MVAPELKLTKNVTVDKDGAGFPLPRNVEDSTFCLWTLKFTDTLEVAWVVRRLHRMEEQQSHIMTNAYSESERSLRELCWKSNDECVQRQNR